MVRIVKDEYGDYVCRFRQHDFQITMEEDGRIYIQVSDDDCFFAYDGYADDNIETVEEAFLDACRGSLIEPPKVKIVVIDDQKSKPKGADDE